MTRCFLERFGSKAKLSIVLGNYEPYMALSVALEGQPVLVILRAPARRAGTLSTFGVDSSTRGEFRRYISPNCVDGRRCSRVVRHDCPVESFHLLSLIHI